MQLHHNTASPFVRKVMATAIETGLEARLELINTAITPINPVDALNHSNPLGKVPALILEDGTSLFDSRVICEYLDSLHHGPRLFPDQGPARWAALRYQALADGIMDAGVSFRYETFLRPQAYRWQEWADNQQLKCLRACDQAEQEVEAFSNLLDIGTLSLACALGYLDFRFADWAWRDNRPALADWYASFSQRPSLARTAPA